jgi:hypothetical protein
MFPASEKGAKKIQEVIVKKLNKVIEDIKKWVIIAYNYRKQYLML